jgi:predicted MPP superfamily phosphohydrolase
MGPFGCIIYGIFLYFLLSAIITLFGGLSWILILELTIAIVLINLFSMGIEAIKSNSITRLLLTASEIFKWMALMYGFLTLIIYIINIAINIPQNILIMIYLTIVPILSIYAYIKAHRIVIREYDIKINNLSENVRIIHISDLHIGSIRNKTLLKDVTNKINSVEADIAVISGDLADGTCAIDDDSFLPLKDSEIPIIFTPGNHDIYPGIENVINAGMNANLRILLDEKMEFKGLNFYGLPLSAYSPTNLKLKSEDSYLQNIDSNQPNILINHLPVSWDYFRSIGIDLQLSGHTHGGQFYPFNFLVKLVFPYLRGLYEEEGSYLSVTDGVGTLTPPMRWGTNAEMVILNLISK